MARALATRQPWPTTHRSRSPYLCEKPCEPFRILSPSLSFILVFFASFPLSFSLTSAISHIKLVPFSFLSSPWQNHPPDELRSANRCLVPGGALLQGVGGERPPGGPSAVTPPAKLRAVSATPRAVERCFSRVVARACRGAAVQAMRQCYGGGRGRCDRL